MSLSHPSLAPGRPPASRWGLPEATVARLPVYHRVLRAMCDAGQRTVASVDLAVACGVSPALLRKDLSHLGSLGVRGVGYDVAALALRIGSELGQAQPWRLVLVGVGNLGRALASYAGFTSRGFTLVGALDANPDLIGTRVGLPGHEVTVQSMAELDRVVGAASAHIGIIATPALVAQYACDRLVAAGITSILNFAPVVLTTPADVEVRKVDLGLELQILAFHEQRRGEEPLPEAMHA